MAVMHRTKDGREWPAWCGELADLTRVATIVEDLAAQRRSEVLSEAGDEDDWRRRMWKDASPLVKVELVEGTDSITGAPTEVLDKLDRRTVKSVGIFINLPGLDEKLKVYFLKGDAYDDFGVKLEVESANPGWAKQSMAQLSDELEKSIPKWGFSLTLAGRFALLAAIYAVLLAFISLIEGKHIHNDLGATVGGSAVLLMIPMIPIVIIGSMVITRIFPRFEVYGEGGSSSGTRRWATFVGLVLTIPLGILINLIS